MKHELTCFVTLTYDDEHLPADGCLQKRDAQLWLKRLREKISPRLLRYFLAGEYGEETMRPHYHAILYGVSFVESHLVASSWTLGGVHVGLAEPKSMSYVSGYILKKMGTRRFLKQQGLTAEFTLMSRKNGGVGIPAVADLVRAYRSESGQSALQAEGWISGQVRIGGKKFPLGRYLSDKITEALGLTKEQRKAYQWKKQMEVFVRKSQTTTTEYERGRKAHVQQQEGRENLHIAPFRRPL